MKRILVIVIFCSLLFQCLAHLGVLGLFALNRNYIAKNLCENRDKPQLKCCGKCYLRKQLGKVNNGGDNSKNGPLKTEKHEVIVYLLPPVLHYSSPHPAAAEQLLNPGRQRMSGCVVRCPVFRPPAV